MEMVIPVPPSSARTSLGRERDLRVGGKEEVGRHGGELADSWESSF